MVLFAHLVGLLGGGLALAADRATLRIASATPADRLRHLSELRAIHRPVLAGLTLTFSSGLLMLSADLEMYLDSRVFWVKMVLIGLLIANGCALRHTEVLLRREARRSGGVCGRGQWRARFCGSPRCSPAPG